MIGDRRPFGRWLLDEIERRFGSQAEFARAGGFKPQNVSRWIAQERTPDQNNVLRIARVLSVDPDEALMRAGFATAREERARPRSFDDLVRQLEAERPIAVPIVEQVASAGRGEPAIGYVYLPPLGGRRPKLFAMRVAGDCMEPKISPGDTIIVDPEKPAEVGKVVIAVAGDNWDQVLLKRVVERDGQRWLKPERGAAVRVDESVRIVGVVIQVIRDV